MTHTHTHGGRIHICHLYQSRKWWNTTGSHHHGPDSYSWCTLSPGRRKGICRIPPLRCQTSPSPLPKEFRKEVLQLSDVCYMIRTITFIFYNGHFKQSILNTYEQPIYSAYRYTRLQIQNILCFGFDPPNIVWLFAMQCNSNCAGMFRQLQKSTSKHYKLLPEVEK